MSRTRGRGNGNHYLMVAGFLFGGMRTFWNQTATSVFLWSLVSLAPLTPHRHFPRCSSSHLLHFLSLLSMFKPLDLLSVLKASSIIPLKLTENYSQRSLLVLSFWLSGHRCRHRQATLYAGFQHGRHGRTTRDSPDRTSSFSNPHFPSSPVATSS